MSTLYSVQSSNVRKTWILMIGFMVFVMAIGYFLYEYYGGSLEIIFIALIVSIVMNISSYWFSDKIVLSMSGARPIDHDTHTELYHIVENLCIASGLPMPKLYIIEDSSPNAFATGRDKNHSAIAVTSGLLKILDKSELEGVIAHELSHVQNKDILLQTVIVVLVGSIALLTDFFLRTSFGRRSDRGSGSGGNLFAIIGIVLLILSPIIAEVIKLAISRKREFLADASAGLMTRYPDGLASALKKISSYEKPLDKAHNATAHLYISNPFGSKKLKGLSKLFMTHPPVEDRIKALLGNRYEQV